MATLSFTTGIFPSSFKFARVTPILKKPIYKLACIIHKALNEQSPAYLYDLLTKHQPIRNTRSSGKSFLVIPATATKVAEGAFRFVTPTIWKSLPDDLRSTTSLSSFKKQLKSFFSKLT